MSMLTEERPVRLDPDYEAALEAIIKGYKGEKRKKVTAALVKFVRTPANGTHAELVAQAETVAKAAVRTGS